MWHALPDGLSAMSNRLILSELRLLFEHYTTSEQPDPDFMRMHALSLVSAIESWAEEVLQEREREARRDRPSLQ